MTPREASQRCAALAERLADAPSTPALAALLKLADNTIRALDESFPRRARFCALLQARTSEAHAWHHVAPGGEPLQKTWGELADALRIAESLFACELERR